MAYAFCVAIRAGKACDLRVSKVCAGALVSQLYRALEPEIESGLITLVGRNVQLQAVRSAVPAFHRPPDVTRLHISDPPLHVRGTYVFITKLQAMRANAMMRRGCAEQRLGAFQPRIADGT